MNGHCSTCPIEKECGYEYKPCDCRDQLKFKPIPKPAPVHTVQDPCDMGAICAGCEPRNMDGSCKDAKPSDENEEIQRLSALVRAQQITIDKLEQALAAPVQVPVGEWVDGRSEAKRIAWKPGYVVNASVGDKIYAAPPAQPAPNMAYSIDADPNGIRKRAADAIIGALALGAQDSSPPPEGHWLQQFWDIGRAEASKATPPAAQRQFVGLTGQQKDMIARISVDVFDAIHRTNAKLKELNT